MRVLVGCERSGRVRDAFRERGHDAWSIDLVDTDAEEKNFHLIGDVLDEAILRMPWDILIAHPPCRYLANSGVRWLYRWVDREKKMIGAALFFRDILNLPIPKIAVENPIIHGYAKELIGRGQDQIIQPWQFGHGETKATCLWLKGLPLLKPTNIVEGREHRIHTMSPGKDRARKRAITYKGIAEAMAHQWG